MNSSVQPVPELTIMPLEELRLHEYVDASRMTPLMEDLNRSGLLRNPPVILPVENHGDAYVVLDGSNRIQALRTLGLMFALVQIIRTQRDELSLGTWNQVILGCNPGDLTDGVMRIPGLRLRALGSNNGRVLTPTGRILAVLSLASDHRWSIETVELNFESKVKHLNTIMRSFAQIGEIQREVMAENDALLHRYPDLAGWLETKTFTIEQVMALSVNGIRLPAGITRFMLSPRALRVNYPLKELRADISLAEARERLDAWLRQRHNVRGVRFYAEATYLYDE